MPQTRKPSAVMQRGDVRKALKTRSFQSADVVALPETPVSPNGKAASYSEIQNHQRRLSGNGSSNHNENGREGDLRQLQPLYPASISFDSNFSYYDEGIYTGRVARKSTRDHGDEDSDAGGGGVLLSPINDELEDLPSSGRESRGSCESGVMNGWTGIERVDDGDGDAVDGYNDDSHLKPDDGSIAMTDPVAEGSLIEGDLSLKSPVSDATFDISNNPSLERFLQNNTIRASQIDFGSSIFDGASSFRRNSRWSHLGPGEADSNYSFPEGSITNVLHDAYAFEKQRNMLAALAQQAAGGADENDEYQKNWREMRLARARQMASKYVRITVRVVDASTFFSTNETARNLEDRMRGLGTEGIEAPSVKSDGVVPRNNNGWDNSDDSEEEIDIAELMAPKPEKGRNDRAPSNDGDDLRGSASPSAKSGARSSGKSGGSIDHRQGSVHSIPKSPKPPPSLLSAMPGDRPPPSPSAASFASSSVASRTESQIMRSSESFKNRRFKAQNEALSSLNGQRSSPSGGTPEDLPSILSFLSGASPSLKSPPMHFASPLTGDGRPSEESEGDVFFDAPDDQDNYDEMVVPYQTDENNQGGDSKKEARVDNEEYNSASKDEEEVNASNNNCLGGSEVIAEVTNTSEDSKSHEENADSGKDNSADKGADNPLTIQTPASTTTGQDFGYFPEMNGIKSRLRVFPLTVSRDSTIEGVARLIEAEFTLRWEQEQQRQQTVPNSAPPTSNGFSVESGTMPILCGALFKGNEALSFNKTVGEVLNTGDIVCVVSYDEKIFCLPGDDGYLQQSSFVDPTNETRRISLSPRSASDLRPIIYRHPSSGGGMGSISNPNTPSHRLNTMAPKGAIYSPIPHTNTLPSVPDQEIDADIANVKAMIKVNRLVSCASLTTRFLNILTSPHMLKAFIDFCALPSELALEPLLFCMDVERFRHVQPNMARLLANYIYLTYLAPGAPLQVLSNFPRESIPWPFLPGWEHDPTIFDSALKKVAFALKKHTLLRFERSPIGLKALMDTGDFDPREYVAPLKYGIEYGPTARIASLYEPEIDVVIWINDLEFDACGTKLLTNLSMLSNQFREQLLSRIIAQFTSMPHASKLSRDYFRLRIRLAPIQKQRKIRKTKKIHGFFGEKPHDEILQQQLMAVVPPSSQSNAYHAAAEILERNKVVETAEDCEDGEATGVADNGSSYYSLDSGLHSISRSETNALKSPVFEYRRFAENSISDDLSLLPARVHGISWRSHIMDGLRTTDDIALDDRRLSGSSMDSILTCALSMIGGSADSVGGNRPLESNIESIRAKLDMLKEEEEEDVGGQGYSGASKNSGQNRKAKASLSPNTINRFKQLPNVPEMHLQRLAGTRIVDFDSETTQSRERSRSDAPLGGDPTSIYLRKKRAEKLREFFGNPVPHPSNFPPVKPNAVPGSSASVPATNAGLKSHRPITQIVPILGSTDIRNINRKGKPRAATTSFPVQIILPPSSAWDPKKILELSQHDRQLLLTRRKKIKSVFGEPLDSEMMEKVTVPFRMRAASLATQGGGEPADNGSHGYKQRESVLLDHVSIGSDVSIPESISEEESDSDDDSSSSISNISLKDGSMIDIKSNSTKIPSLYDLPRRSTEESYTEPVSPFSDTSDMTFEERERKLNKRRLVKIRDMLGPNVGPEHIRASAHRRSRSSHTYSRPFISSNQRHFVSNNSDPTIPKVPSINDFVISNNLKNISEKQRKLGKQRVAKLQHILGELPPHFQAVYPEANTRDISSSSGNGYTPDQELSTSDSEDDSEADSDDVNVPDSTSVKSSVSNIAAPIRPVVPVSAKPRRSASWGSQNVPPLVVSKSETAASSNVVADNSSSRLSISSSQVNERRKIDKLSKFFGDTLDQEALRNQRLKSKSGAGDEMDPSLPINLSELDQSKSNPDGKIYATTGHASLLTPRVSKTTTTLKKFHTLGRGIRKGSAHLRISLAPGPKIQKSHSVSKDNGNATPRWTLGHKSMRKTFSSKGTKMKDEKNTVDDVEVNVKSSPPPPPLPPKDKVPELKGIRRDISIAEVSPRVYSPTTPFSLVLPSSALSQDTFGTDLFSFPNDECSEAYVSDTSSNHKNSAPRVDKGAAKDHIYSTPAPLSPVDDEDEDDGDLTPSKAFFSNYTIVQDNGKSDSGDSFQPMSLQAVNESHNDDDAANSGKEKTEIKEVYCPSSGALPVSQSWGPRGSVSFGSAS
ncbi:hypothetical protein H4219_001217 [Mycoemilia scoparia]|uniref:RGS domain-containing protein n=1 Tax=Mycoemilia scoparia TaxID=417184 RepID=A0A9W8A0W6_9FUNG|nr:hypothetical protein H4219_001217 [Mycoemilia scoparia]